MYSFGYPVWLACTAGLIEKSRLLDAAAEGLDDAAVVRIAAEYDLVVMSTSTPEVRCSVRLAGLLKQATPHLKIGMVGPHAMALPRETLGLSYPLDFVTTGEFDHVVAEIAAGIPFSKVNGIMYRAGHRLVRTADRLPVKDLDSLPFASEIYARDLSVDNYFKGYLRHPYVSFHTGRGCRSRCTYCLWPQTVGGHAYRVRTPENVYEEMLIAMRLFPRVKEFFFDDDTFTDDTQRAIQIARRVKSLGIAWSCNARPNVSRETLRVLKNCGLRLLAVGFESGNQNILNGIRKGIILERAREFMRAAKETGVLVHGAFILGLPGETAETLEETVRYAIELDPYSLQVSLLAPHPGTELYAQGVKEGWITREGSLLRGDTMPDFPVSCPGLSREEIFEAVERFYRRFYLRPGRVLRIFRELFRDRDEFSRSIREGRQMFSFMIKRKETVL